MVGNGRSRPGARRCAVGRPAAPATATAAGTKPEPGARRGLAAPLQGSSSRTTAQGSGKRPAVSQAPAGAAAAVAAEAATFQQPASAAAGAHPQPDGDLGAPDSRTERKGAGTLPAAATASARAATGGAGSDSRIAQHASGAERAVIEFRTVQEPVLGPGARVVAGHLAAAAGAARKSARERGAGGAVETRLRSVVPAPA